MNLIKIIIEGVKEMKKIMKKIQKRKRTQKRKRGRRKEKKKLILSKKEKEEKIKLEVKKVINEEVKFINKRNQRRNKTRIFFDYLFI